jgi:peptide/nickel transport system substrate-binding protein
MNKIITVAAILSLVLVASMLIMPIANAHGPPLKRPMDFYEATIEGGSPQSVDYSWIYDTASAEIVFNTMDTLIMFDAEHVDRYIPSIAASWRLDTLTPASGSDSGIPIAGLTFENPTNQSGANATYYYRYVFGLNTTIPIYFQPPYNYLLTAADVVYSFHRTLVQDRVAGPQWMLQEPLLDNAAGDNITIGGIADLANENQVYELGRLIEKAVMVNPANSSEIWFNIMFPGAYAPFLQILTQTWSSIISKQWINNQVIGAGRPDWDGTWGIKSGWTKDHTSWVTTHNPAVSPLDSPTPICYGSGPFILTPGTPDYVSKFWAAYRYIGYWRGWPSPWPTLANVKPAGYPNTIETTWAFGWATRKTMFLQGDCDFVELPSKAFTGELYQSLVPPFYPPYPSSGDPNYPLYGVRAIYPLPELEADALFFTFEISSSTPYQPLCLAGTFNPGAIPPDFFGNPTWGIHVRRGFAEAFNYAQFLAAAALNEGVTPASAIIEGLPYYNSSIKAYSFNIAAARSELEKAVDKNGKKLVNVGATIDLYYNTGNLARKTGCQLLQAGLTSACSNLTIRIHSVDWCSYLTAAVHQNLAIFAIGRLADFPDPHDFVFQFYHTGGAFASWQAYSNSTIDAKIDQAIVAPDGQQRQDLYNQIAQMAIADCPDFMILQPYGRHFERDWVNGWYFNPVCPGYYYYNLWKWYYLPEALYNTTWNNINQPNSTYLPADLTYDGKVDITDVATAAKAFGSNPTYPRWVFRADITGDRKIQMDDVAYISKQFGKKGQPVWTPQGLLVYITPAIQMLGATATWTWTSTVIGGTGPYTYVWSANGTAIGGNAPTLAYTSWGEGKCYLQLNVTDSSPTVKKGQSELAWVTSKQLTVAIDLSATATVTGTLEETLYFSSTVDGGTINSSLEGGYHYQWYSNQTTGVMHAIGGATHPTYDLTVTAADIGDVIEVYLRVTDSSNTGPVVVDSDHTLVPTVFSVGISPAGATLNVTRSESQVFSSTVTDATLPVSYQWYDNTTGSCLPVSGETGSTYTFAPTTSGVYGVYLVVTDSRLVSVPSATSIVTAVS